MVALSPLRRERRSAFPTPVLACSDVMSGQDAPPTSVTRLIHIVLLWSTEIGTYRPSTDISLLWSENSAIHRRGEVTSPDGLGNPTPTDCPSGALMYLVVPHCYKHAAPLGLNASRTKIQGGPSIVGARSPRPTLPVFPSVCGLGNPTPTD